MLRFLIPWAQVRGARGQLATTVLAIALGVALSASILLVNDALLLSLEESMEAAAGKADLRAVARGGGSIDENLVGRIKAVPGVAVAVPVVTGTAFIDDGSGDAVNVYGVDMLGDGAVRLYQVRGENAVEMDDPLVFLSQPDSVILTREFMERRGLQRDATVSLVTPTGVRSLTIRGVLEPRGVARAFGGRLAVMDVVAASQMFLADGQVSEVDVVLEKGADPAAVAAGIAAAVPAGVAVEPTGMRREGMRRLLAGFQLMLNGLGILGLVVSFLITFNRLSTVFLIRLWEVGISRALGATRTVIVRELLKESALVGLAGVVLGLLVAVPLAGLIVPAVTELLSSGLDLPAQARTVPLRATPLLVATALGLGATLLAAILPALRVARAPVVDVVRRRGLLELPAGRPGARRLVRVGLVVLTAGLLGAEAERGTGTLALVAIPLVLVSACFLIGPALAAVQRPLSWVMRRTFGPTGRFAVVDLVRTPHRTVMTISILAVGLSSVVWFDVMARSFELFVMQCLGGVRAADLIVASSFSEGKDAAPISEAILAELSAIPGVATVSGERVVMLSAGPESVGAVAFDAEHFRNRRLATWAFDGRPLPDALERVARGEAILASSGFALHRGTRLGDEVALEGSAGTRRLPLAGLSTISFWSATGDIVLARDLYRSLWNDDLITRAHVLVAAGVDPEGVRSEVARRLGQRYRIQVLSARELTDSFGKLVRGAFVMTDVIVLVTLLVVVLGTADALVASVIDRMREIGTMRALGVGGSRVAVLLTLESLTMGVLGALIALGSGLLMAFLWVRFSMRPVLGWVVTLSVPWGGLARTVVLGAGACALAAIVPARHAMRVPPAEALRCE